MLTLFDLFTRHAGLSFAKQLALTEWLGKHQWTLNLEQGNVDFGVSALFGKPRIHPIQLVGTESETSRTFQWTWANTQDTPAPKVLEAAGQLRALGEEHRIPELLAPSLPLSDWTGHQAAMVAAGVTHAGAYYRGPYRGGAVFFLVPDAPSCSPLPVQRIVHVITQVIANWEIPHRAMAQSFLEQEGFTTKRAKSSLRARHRDGRKLEIDFDSKGHIVQMSHK